MSRRDAIVLILIVALGAWLRWPLLAEGFWRDEASTYYDVAAKGLAGTLAMIVRIELAPPAYFLVEKGWAHLFGVDAFVLKLPSFIYGLALIVVTYALGRAAASSPAGLVAAAFAAVSLPAIDLSAEARVYAFSGLFAALTLTAYVRGLGSRRPAGALTAFAVLGIVLAYSNYGGCLLLALLAAATLVTFALRRNARRLPGFAIAFAVIAVAYLPWLPSMLEHARIGAPFQERTTLETFFNVVNNDFGHLWPFASRHGQLGLLFAVGAVVWIVVAIGRLRRGASFARPGAVFVLAFCTVSGAGAQALLSLREPRYIFTFAPAAWVWFAWLAVLLWAWLVGARRWQKISAGIVALVLAALFIPSERASRDEGPIVSSGIRDLAPGAIALQRRKRPLFVVAPDYLGPTFGYYVSRPTGAPVYGFARWSNPQIFVTKGYRALWTDPSVLADAERNIRDAMRKDDDRLVLVRDNILIDRASMPYTRANDLISWIRINYRMLSNQEYWGRQEDVVMEVYAPPASVSRSSKSASWSNLATSR